MEKVLNKCIDVYKLPCYWTSTKIDNYLMGCYYNYFPEIGEFQNYNLNPDFEKENTRIITKIHMHYYRDTRRYWRLASVWYINEDYIEIPFMVIQNAGREGDDYTTRIISDELTFIKVYNYLRELILNSSNIENFIKNEILKDPVKSIIMTNDDENSEIDTYIDNDEYPIIYTRQRWGTIDGVRKYVTHKGLGYFSGQDYFETLNGMMDGEDEYGPTGGHIVTMKEEVDY